MTGARLTEGARRGRGLGLVELTVALMLGLLLLAGAITLLVQSRTERRAGSALTDGQAALDTAVELLSRELRLAGNYGLTNRAELIRGAASALQQRSPLDATIGNSCANNFSVALGEYVGAQLRGNPNLACAALPVAVGSDVLVVRRAGAAAARGRIRLRSNRLGGEILAASEADPATDPGSETRELVVEAYYVAASAAHPRAATEWALHRVRLGAASDGRPEMRDQVLVPGIALLRVEFGLDLDGDGSADLYALPGAPDLSRGRIVSARLTLGAPVTADGSAGRALVRVVQLRNATVR